MRWSKGALLSGVTGLVLGCYMTIYFAIPLGSWCSSYMVYPCMRLHTFLKEYITSYAQRLRSLDALHKELAETRQERNAFLKELIELRALAHYQEETKDLAAFKARYKYHDALIAHVLQRHFPDQAHYIIIDQGSRQGIVPGMVVVTNHIIIGKITKVYPWYSVVTLISDRSCKIGAYTATTHVRGIHEGIQQKEKSVLSFVSHLEKIQSDELVLSSGEGTVFPRGFALGKITQCEHEGLFYSIQIEPLISLDAISYCLILPYNAHELHLDYCL